MSSEASSEDYAIEVSGLGKCYQIYSKPSDRLRQMLVGGRRQYFKEFWALKDVSFRIQKGETVGIIGRNGSGKSTLLQIICGTLNPTQGAVKVRGRVAALLELGAGFNPEFSGVENIYMAASLYGLSKAEVDQRIDAIAAFADIGDHIHQPVKTYSSGMYVRLAFAVIAHVDADILVVDEALSVGDAVFTQKCMRFIRKFRENGTLLFVSHDTSAVTNICQSAVLLSHGAVISTGSAKSVVERYLELIYQQTQNIETSAISNEENRNNLIFNSSSIQYRDMRADFINSTNLRNDIKVFEFDENAPSFGMGGAKLEYLYLLDNADKCLLYLVGGEEVVLKIAFKAYQSIQKPIIGFTFKDRLGQPLFVDNTYFSTLKAPISANEGDTLIARFEFRCPVLPAGQYSISPAIADGTQDDHVQLNWIHDAMILEVQASSVCHGLIGLGMKNITLNLG
ncbi:MAG: transporter ATP-binding protein [Pseudomonadota bacterium]|jgi:lipopolysaccharide transport system ATP-binding protein